ncbi:hypothetical protein M5D96_014139 [Drosophila gunungcola]|uniref:HAT C-terminal dimerisation domain-containing protein n=1 Tax=Drosophila gunungcola TaxID=103775 RepID=A0A9P9YAK0_9MUSC|nr:hypothetical protein M5D96_014139 [Drosophila gunungcola]
MDIFAVGNMLQANKTPDKIISLLEHFKYENIDEIVSQFGKIHLINWEKKEITIEFWSEVLMYKDAGQNKAFEQLALYALHILSLPWSNAALERVFSQINMVKTKLRNKMNLKSLNAILRIRYGLRRHGKCCLDYILPTKYLALVSSSAKYMESNDEVDEIISLL